MKFDLALDPSRDVLYVEGAGGCGCHGASAGCSACPPMNGIMQRLDRQAAGAAARRVSLWSGAAADFVAGLPEPAEPAGGPPVLHAVVAPGVLVHVLHHEAARLAELNRETVFQATLAAEDTLVVPQGAQVSGNLEAANVHVQGCVYGMVRATRGCLVVDRGATVHGMVQGVGTVVIAGWVRAAGGGVAVEAQGKLRLARSARVKGAVHYTEIEIYDGALVAGPLLALGQV